MCPPGSATAFASLRRITLASSGIGSAAAASSLPTSFTSAARPARLARSVSALERPVRAAGIEHLAHLPVDRLAEPALGAQRHQRRDLVGERRHAEHGGEHQHDDRDDAPADDLHPAAPLARAGAVDRHGRLVDRGRERGVAHFKPRGDHRADLAEPQQAGRRRDMVEPVVAPAREDVAVLFVADDKNIGRKLDQHEPFRAGHAVEEDRLAGCQHRQIPPTCRASAKPSPTGEPVAGAALTRSSTSTLVSSTELEALPPEAQLHRRLIDRRIGERRDHVDADCDRALQQLARRAVAGHEADSPDRPARDGGRRLPRPVRRACDIHTKRQ